MALAIRGAITTATDGSISSLNIVLTKPTGVVNGDLLYVLIQLSADCTITAPSGWTLVDSDTANIVARLYRKTASSEGSTFAFTGSSLGGNTAAVGMCIAVYDDAGAGNPVQDVYVETIDTSADTNADNTGVTPTFSPGSMLISFMSGKGSEFTFSAYAVANNNPTWAGTNQTRNFGGESCCAGIAYATGRDLITATGAYSSTISGSLATAVYLVSVQPAGISATSPLMGVATVVPTPSNSEVASETANPLVATGAIPTPVATQADPKFVNSSKNSSTMANSSKNTISPANTSKNAISPTNTTKST